MEFSKTNQRWFTAMVGLLILGFLTLFWGVWHHAPFIDRIDEFGYKVIFTGNNPLRTHIAEGISLFGNFIVLGILVIAVAIWLWRKHEQMLAKWFAGSFFLIGCVGTLSVKYLVQRPRPPYHLVKEIGFSFPSGHAMLSSTFFWLLAGLALVFIMRAGHLTVAKRSLVLLGAFVLILIVCWSRVTLGVHYLSDVSAGFMLGSAGVLLTSAFANAMWHRRAVRPDNM